MNRRTLLKLSAAAAVFPALPVLAQNQSATIRDVYIYAYQVMTEQLLDAKREVSQLGDTLIVARKQEHRRIAQQLHDTTAQKLVAADLYLQSMARTRLPPDGDAPLPIVRDLLSQALEELRTFSFLLRPDQLSAEDFRDYLHNTISGFCDRAGLRCYTDFPEWVDDLDEPTQSVLLRITREALSNIYRHASAKSVSAHITITDRAYVLMIVDDGLGGITYPPRLGQKLAGLGIAGMAEALAEHSGTLDITPLAVGTRLIASVSARAFEHQTP